VSASLHLPLTDDEVMRLHAAGVHLDSGKVMLLEHPDLFISHYFRHRLSDLKDFHLRLIEAGTRHRRSVVLFPAAHGKTTIISGCLPIYDLCRNPDVREALIAKNERDAQSIMRAIQAELVDNTELIRDFGPFRDMTKGSTKPWSVGKIEVAHRRIRHPSPTIRVFGSGGNVLGQRADIVRCDDVVTDKNSATPELRAKVREWFNLGVETMPEDASGTITVVGTRFHPEDLYGDLIELAERAEEGEETWHVQWEDAIVDEEAHVALWPEQWPWERLMGQKRKMGTLDFNKRYRNIAVDPSRLVFREEYIRGGYVDNVRVPGCLDRDFKAGDIDEGWLRYGGFDPAIGTTRGHSFSVHTVLMVGSCQRHERCYWIVDQERDTMTLPQQADLILDRHERYGLNATKVEINVYQQGLQQLIEERMRQRGIALKIDGHLTTAQKKIDPEIGVQAMAPYFERGLFHIPWGDQYSQRRMGPLIEELVNYPNHRTTDCVMSLWIAWLAARQEAPMFRSFNRLHRQTNDWPLRRMRPGQWEIPNPYYVRDEPAYVVLDDG
jgi:phage terminase large subunit-like protein